MSDVDVAKATTFKFSVKIEFADETDKDQVTAAIQEALQPMSLVVRKNTGSRKKLEDTDKEAIIAARQGGASYKVLSSEYNVSVAVINKILREAGLTKQWLSAEARAEQEAARAAAVANEADDTGEDEDDSDDEGDNF